MKKYIFILFAAASLFCACQDAVVDTTSGPISNLAAEPNIGAVVLTWDNPTLGDYYYSIVEYVNSAGENVKIKVSKYSEDPSLGDGHTRYTIKGFEDTNVHEFKVTPYTADGYAGETMTVSCAPEDKSMAYKYIAATSSARALVEGAYVKWVNEYEVPVNLTITYKNLAGETVVKNIDDSYLTDSLEIYAFVDPTTITVVSSNDAGAKSAEKSLSVTPLRGEIPHNRMFVPVASSIWAAQYDTKYLLDDNVNTYWHTNLFITYPNWFIVDMREQHRVNWVEVVRRVDESAGGTPLQIGLEYSNDGATFTEIGKFDFDQELVYNHAFNFDPVDCRWIRVTLYNDPFPHYTYLSEFLAYYADNATHYADEAAKELMPDPDDDPTYYPDIEYLIPFTDVAGWLNNVTVEQSNPDNPSQYTYRTTGGDSWLPLQALKKDAAGTVLVFQYQSTAQLMCEFFWCNGGFGVGGPAGGKETAFTIRQTKEGEWKTLKQNMAGPFAQWGFGKAGDTVRFDIGDGPGQTVVVRNMHWRAAEPGE